MLKSLIPMIEHVPNFLDYCNKIGLSKKKFINYKICLERFTKWLEKENNKNLLPHELTIANINSYKSYLASFPSKNGQTLKTITQNHYPIALRALLDYFATKELESLPISGIQLLKEEKKQKDINLLDQKQIKRLLASPNTSNLIGLRDRAILGILIYSGLKIDQLKNLNKNQPEQYDLIPKEAFLLIKEYLRNRDDGCHALFINYRTGKNSQKRLTARSIERIVNYYGKKTNLPFLITPETLRWSRANMILNKIIPVKRIFSHRISTIKDYDCKEYDSDITIQRKVKAHSPTWYVIENSIEKEILWLKNSISFLPERYKNNPSFLKCDDCILRKIAILIVSGTVRATQFRIENDKDTWKVFVKKLDLRRLNRHGQKWHKKMMDVIYEYFSSKEYKVTIEPVLNYGRADLGVHSKSKEIIIEVGTVSLYKLWYNLSTMENVSFLLVPSEEIIIEFNT